MENFKFKTERIIKFKTNVMVQIPPDLKEEDIKVYQVHVEGMQVSPFRIRAFSALEKATEYVNMLKNKGVDFRVSLIVDLNS